MSSLLEIRALGGLTIHWNGARLARFESRKMEALLVYLAYTGQSQSREFLGELLWDDRTQKQSLANLRLLLHRLRPTVELVTTRRTVSAAQPYWIDARELSERMMTVEAQPVQDMATVSQETITSLEYALSLYQGDFLVGFYIPDARNFDDWMFFERERLRLHVIKMTDLLIQIYLARGASLDGIRHAQRLLQVDPFHEGTRRNLMRLYRQAGQITAVKAEYETYRRLLADELQIEPTDETQALYAEIIQAERQPTSVQTAPSSAENRTESIDLARPSQFAHLPAQSTPFVGRENEVAELRTLLADPAHRLISIVGPGGMGKTRLALEVAAQESGQYPNGVCFVALAPLTSPDFVLPTVAEAVGLQMTEGSDLRQRLLDYCREKKLLLVMDNFEHVLDASPLISDILHASPHVKALGTSREPLAIEGERLFRIKGMDFPDWEIPEHILEFSAVKLFLHSAQRIEPAFSLQADDLPYLSSICKQLGGMPLAIQLAASWVQVLSLAEISLEIKHSADFLVNQQRDAPARQQSIRTVFGYSWSFLTEEERRAYARLSVFRSSFTREGAQEVGEASPRILKGLINKSMLNRDTTGRYDIHALLRHYAAEELARYPDEAEAIQNAYCRYYANFVAQRRTDLFGPHQMRVMAELDSEWVNIQLAWEYAAQNRCQTELRLMTLDLLYYARVRGIDGEALFRQAVDHLKTETAGEDLSLALALLALGASSLFTHKSGEGLALLEQSLSILRRHDFPRAIATALHYSGNASRGIEKNWQSVIDTYHESVAIFKTLNLLAETSDVLNDLAWYLRDLHETLEAKQTLVDALSFARQSGAPERIVNVLGLLGRIESIEGHHAQAEAIFAEIFALLPVLDSSTMSAKIWHFWGGVAYAQKDFDEAERRWQTALQLYQEMGYNILAEAVRGNLGLTDYWQGKYAESRQKLLKVVSVYREAGLLFGLSGMLNNLGYPTTALKHYSEAEGYFREALTLAIQTENVVGKLDAIIGLANLAARAGQPERAIEWLAMAVNHPRLLDELKLFAESTLAWVESQVAPDLFAVVWQRGSTLDLDTVAVEILREKTLT